MHYFQLCDCAYMIFLNRNLNVAEDNEFGKDENEDSGDLVSGLYCKIVVQFDNYKDCHDAMRVLCGRSMQKVLV